MWSNLLNQHAVVRSFVGIDIGGTFTDLAFVSLDRSTVAVEKVLTTPDNPAIGVVTALKKLRDDYEVDGEDIEAMAHATTLVTNTIIERKGVNTALIMTKGHEDVVHIGRETRYSFYDLFAEMPEPLLPRNLCRGVTERTGPDGRIEIPADLSEAEEIIEELALHEVKSLAVCFINSYLNPHHELELERIISQKFPDLSVSISSKIAPELGEFERASTTVANAYVQPIVEDYLKLLTSESRSWGIPTEPIVMLSSGGMATVETAARFPVLAVESGPAAGALLAGLVGELLECSRLVGFDMGGTTAKLSVVHDYEPLIIYGHEVARVARFEPGSGLPLRSAAIELIEIGAGGGSIGRIDELGLLKIGPFSAGADPGPACYGLGGTEPTVTDADVVLGYVDPDFFLGGEMTLDVKESERAITTMLAEPLSLSTERASWAIHDLVNENMASALRIHMAHKGVRARDYTLVAFGGAGPLHAVGIARKVGISRIIVPPSAGVGSALGLLAASPRVHLVRAYPSILAEVEPKRVSALYDSMESEGENLLGTLGVDDLDRIVRLDMRFQGQAHTQTITVSPESVIEFDSASIASQFMSAYRQIYGQVVPKKPIEVVNWRLEVRRSSSTRSQLLEGLRHAVQAGGDGSRKDRSIIGHRRAYAPEARDYVPVPVHLRDKMETGFSGEGPAIVVEKQATTWVDHDWAFSVDQLGNLVLSNTRHQTPESEAS